MRLFTLIAMLVGLGGCSKPADNKELFVYTWADYYAADTISNFEKEFGVKVTVANFTSGQDLRSKLIGGGGNYDVVFPSDDDLKILATAAVLESIDASKLSNLKNLGERFRKDVSLAVPYMWGTTGIAVNTEKIADPIDSWAALWDPKYEKVSMLDDARECFASAFRLLGKDINTTDKADIEAARLKLIAQKANKNLVPYNSQPKDALVGGLAYLSQCYSGDAYQAASENKAIKFIIPKEGSTIWVDYMAIPKASKNKDLAHKFINYLLRDDVSAALTNTIGYANPNEAARSKIKPEALANPITNPPEDSIKRCERLKDIGETRDAIEDAWTEVKRK